MSKIIPKKPGLVYNSIEHQSKTAANSLTIGEWNRVVNILKQQTNLNTKYLENLHRLLFYDWNSDDSGYAVGGILPVFYEDPEDADLQGQIDNIVSESAHMIKDVKYNSVNGVLTFTEHDGTTKEIDLPLELKVSISDIIDDLVSTDVDKPLSANQGKVLNDKKVDKTFFDVAKMVLDGHIINLQNDKVDKTQTIIGLDLQDNILLGEFKEKLGEATQSVAGLLSAEDKTHLDGLVALLETNDYNNVVDTIGEILAIFQNYPEGAELVTILQGKVDKVVGKGLSTNDFTDEYKNKVDTLNTRDEMVYFNYAGNIYGDKYSLLASAWEHSLTVDVIDKDHYQNGTIEGVIIPQGVTSIGTDAFDSWTSNNQPLVIPNSVTSIGYRAFNSWTSNNQPLVIPNSVTSIGAVAFYKWTSNNQPLVIPDSVTSIGYGAFGYWQSVPYIEIQATTPPTLTDANAFGNQNDAPIYVPDDSVDDYKTATNWVDLASRIFSINENTNVISAEVDPNAMSYFNYASRIYGDKYSLLASAWESSLTVDPLEISENSTISSSRGTAQYPNGETEGVIIPDSVTSIGSYAFRNWDSNNQPLVIPDSVTSIGDSAFRNWTSNNQPLVIPNSVTGIRTQAFRNWTSNNQPLVIPDSVTSIGERAFDSWTSNNQPLVIPNSVTDIGTGAFAGWTSNNQPLVIPNSVTSIGNDAFGGWLSVPYVEIQAITPPSISSDYAFNNQNNKPIYVPDESVNTYKTATNWVSLASRIFPISDKLTNLIKIDDETITRNNNNELEVANAILDDIESRVPKNEFETFKTTNNNKINAIENGLQIQIDEMEFVVDITLVGNDIKVEHRDGDITYIPVNEAVESGYYDTNTEELVLELANGNEVRIPAGDIVAGLASVDYIDTGLALKENKSNKITELAGVPNNTQYMSAKLTNDLIMAARTEFNSMLDDKVDKVSGKELSTNDYTTTEKNKLSGIETGAEVNEVNSVNGKQGVVVLNQDDIGDGATYKQVSQVEKNTWNNKQDKLIAGNNITIDENTNVISAEVDLNMLGYMNYAADIFYRGKRQSLFANAWESSLTVDPLEISADSSSLNSRGTEQYPNGETEGVVIPHSITSIGPYAFYYWESNNQPLVIPNSVTSIGNNAFRNWDSNNQPLVIPDSVTSIGTQAFYNWNSNNQPLTIPNSVTSIGVAAFQNWLSVPYIEIQAITPPTLSHTNAFSFQNDAPIYVPDESVTTYKTTTNWVSLASRIFSINDK